jgi:two-component system, NarL family, sensor kinase
MTTVAVPAPGPRHPAGWPAATIVLTVVGVAGGVVVLLLARAAPAGFRTGVLSSLCYLLPYGLVGAFLIRRRPDLPFGWLLSGTAALQTVSVLGQGIGAMQLLHHVGGGWPVLLIETGSLQFTAVAVQGLINVRFPSGRIGSRFGRCLNGLMITGVVLLLIGTTLGASTAESISASLHRTVRNPLTGDGTVAHAADRLEVSGPLIVLLGLIAGIHIVVRAWRAQGVERQQLMWRGAGVIVDLVLFPLAVMEVLPTVFNLVDGTVFVATLAIPVVRYKLWDIDAVIRRSVGYALVTVVLAAAYLGVVAIGVQIASERAGVVVAAFVVAMAFGPARAVIQRAVDRVFYGQRNDPYRAMSEVNRRLAAVAEPGTVLPAVVHGVAMSLRLPYVAIERGGLVVAAHGARPAVDPERWELVYRGTPVGTLVAAPRSGETVFGRRDRTVLAGLADQLGAAVHAEALTSDLIESRQRLVNAREDERRRLRRELHDSLGPMLTALGLNVDAARARLATLREAAEVDATLGRAKEVSSRAIEDLRGIVYGLRPPALDDLGLIGAVRANAAKLTDGTGITVSVEPGDVGELPAAVEVAAFRIAVEAISNVVRHSTARTCSVRFRVTPGSGMTVDVVDDNPDTGAWTPGVGMLAMRERAAELGGDLDAGPTPAGGRVHARLPLTAQPATQLVEAR